MLKFFTLSVAIACGFASIYAPDPLAAVLVGLGLASAVAHGQEMAS